TGISDMLLKRTKFCPIAPSPIICAPVDSDRRTCLGRHLCGSRAARSLEATGKRSSLMMRHSILIAAAALLLVPAVSNAQFKQGDWELTLGGSGSSPSRLNGFSFGVDAGLGLFVADQLEIGVRQHAAYTDLSGASGAN